jgi:hypothetical protein
MRLCGRLDGGLGLSAASGIDLAHFQCRRLSKKGQFRVQILESITAFTPKKPALLARL